MEKAALAVLDRIRVWHFGTLMNLFVVIQCSFLNNKIVFYRKNYTTSIFSGFIKLANLNYLFDVNL